MKRLTGSIVVIADIRIEEVTLIKIKAGGFSRGSCFRPFSMEAFSVPLPFPLQTTDGW